MPARAELLHGKLTEQIIGAFQQVVYELGLGFAESVYERAMVVTLRDLGIGVERQARVLVHFRGEVVGDFCADLLVEGLVFVELKACPAIVQAHEAQLLNYLRATRVEVGLILHVAEKPGIRRLIFTNDRKVHMAHESSWPTIVRAAPERKPTATTETHGNQHGNTTE